MDKQNVTAFLKDLFAKGQKITLFVILITFGYSLCELYHYTKKPQQETKKTRTIKETSVAINERGELMIINRVNGDFEVYQDSIGKSIFNLYALSMQAKYEKK